MHTTAIIITQQVTKLCTVCVACHRGLAVLSYGMEGKHAMWRAKAIPCLVAIMTAENMAFDDLVPAGINMGEQSVLFSPLRCGQHSTLTNAYLLRHYIYI